MQQILLHDNFERKLVVLIFIRVHILEKKEIKRLLLMFYLKVVGSSKEQKKVMSRYVGPRLRILRRLGKLRGLTRKKPFRRIFRGMGFLKEKSSPLDNMVFQNL